MTYKGGCHCGAVSYEVEADLAEAISCNCSHCGKKGFVLAFVPESAFALRSGEEELTEYRFNKKTIAHLFCKTCGTESFARGESPNGPMIAVNIRCLEGVDIDSLTVTPVNGKDF